MAARAGQPLLALDSVALTVDNYDAMATVSISQQVIIPPSRLQAANYASDFPIGGIKNTGGGARTEVLPIFVHSVVHRNNTRGEGNTGRWQNIGKAPQDVKGIGFDYWEKVLLDPTVQNLGNVVSDTIFNATIRNTFRRDNRSITSIDNNAGAGITIDGSTPPANLAPLADKVYIITVTTDGPPTIEGTIDWVTNSGTLQLLITGTRIIIFPYTPQSDIKETLRWLTDVVRSADGSEQRHSLRDDPRQSVAYEIVATSLANINKIKNLFVDWTSRVFGVPVWWYERSLRADVLTNDLTIYVRPGGLDFADFRIGGLAMVFQENADGSVIKDTLQIASIIKSVSSPESEQDSITFATAVQNDYDGDLATVVPVVPSILAAPAKQTTPSAANSSRFKMNFDMLENDPDIPGVDNTAYPELDDFDGNPTIIIDDKNSLDGTMLSEQWEQQLQRIDFKVGKFQQLTQELRARRSTPFKWIVEDVNFEWDLRSLLYYLRGKLRNAWLPTHRHDFNVNTNIGISSSSFDVDNWDFAGFVDGGRPWAGCRIEKDDGSISYHRITSAVVIDTTTERINIDPPTTFAALVSEVIRVDLLILARMGSDDVTITHEWVDAESDVIDSVIDTVFTGDVQS
jgi:hypothetical protein